jgi:hypothetical protein
MSMQRPFAGRSECLKNLLYNGAARHLFRLRFARNEIVGRIVLRFASRLSFTLRQEDKNMTSLTPQELEGRLNAHREMMIEMLAAMIGGEVTITTFLKKQRDDATFKDNE